MALSGSSKQRIASAGASRGGETRVRLSSFLASFVWPPLIAEVVGNAAVARPLGPPPFWTPGEELGAGAGGAASSSAPLPLVGIGSMVLLISCNTQLESPEKGTGPVILGVLSPFPDNALIRKRWERPGFQTAGARSFPALLRGVPPSV